MPAAVQTTCALCGLDRAANDPVRVFNGEELGYCCAGCMNVYAILLESGIVQPGVELRDTDLFRRSLELGLISKGPKAKDFVVPAGTQTQERFFRLTGMWCSACAWLIEHSLLRQRGVAAAEVSFASDLLKVTYYPQYCPPDRIASRVESLGYHVHDYQPGEDSPAYAIERRSLTLRLGVAAFLWINVMTLNLSVYAGYFQRLPDGIRGALPFVVMALASPVVLYCAWPILRAAAVGLRSLTLRMETLLSLGLLAAYSYSAVQAFNGGTHIYFDIACAIVTLVLLGKRIEFGAKEKAAQGITAMYRMMPNKARLLEDGREHFVAIDRLQRGQVFVVKAGERIPADGIVIEGEAHADESLLTGESVPVDKTPGSKVVCGSINTNGVLKIEATTVGAQSTLAQILATVERALLSRSQLERTVDRVSRIFVPSVIVLAVLTFFGWGFGAGLDTGEALMRAITVLVIACPCALGIATPLAISAAVEAASRRGILVADSRVLETLRKVDTVIFDKTGTVTTGDFSLLDYAPADLPWLAALEANSEHPLGRAVVHEAEVLRLRIPPAANPTIHKGLGIAGIVAGRHVAIGNRRFVGPLPDHLEAQARHWETQGRTVAFYAWDGRVQGTLAFGDRLRPQARDLVEDLKRRGLRVMLVSGDSRETTASIAAEVGADAFEAEMLPDQKAEIIDRLSSAGRVVAMIGDGINDAPALARAELGIAMGSGAEIAMRAAAIVITNNQLHRVLDAFELSAATIQVIHQNLFWAFFYNVVGISVAVAGWLNPIVAAVAMIVSSAFVVGNSHRLSRRGE